MNGSLANVHPGEILQREFMDPCGLDFHDLAGLLGVPAIMIAYLLDGHQTITPDLALRLERLFGTTAKFWMNIQHDYDLEETAPRIEAALAAIEPYGRRGESIDVD